MTFSITGRCGRTGQVGVAITTSSIAVGSRCPWVRAGVGAVATQNVTMPSIGNDVLDRIEGGATAQEALDAVMAQEKFPDYRQVAVVDHAGNTAPLYEQFEICLVEYDHRERHLYPALYPGDGPDLMM